MNREDIFKRLKKVLKRRQILTHESGHDQMVYFHTIDNKISVSVDLGLRQMTVTAEENGSESRCHFFESRRADWKLTIGEGGPESRAVEIMGELAKSVISAQNWKLVFTYSCKEYEQRMSDLADELKEATELMDLQADIQGAVNSYLNDEPIKA